MKVVINACYGGFGLSDAAFLRLAELGIPVRPYIAQKRGPDGLWLPQPNNEGQIILDYGHPETTYEASFMTLDRHIALCGRYSASWLCSYEHRTDSRLVQVVEELGAAASGPRAKLKVVEVPDGVEFEISDYDGVERVHESHRSWS